MTDKVIEELRAEIRELKVKNAGLEERVRRIEEVQMRESLPVDRKLYIKELARGGKAALKAHNERALRAMGKKK